jgi:hypothetical protein
LRRNPAISLSELTRAATQWNRRQKKLSAGSINERAVRVAARGLKEFPGGIATTSGRKAQPKPKGEPRTVTHHPNPKRTGRHARKRALKAFVREQLERTPSLSLAELTRLAGDAAERDPRFEGRRVSEEAVRNAARGVKEFD